MSRNLDRRCLQKCAHCGAIAAEIALLVGWPSSSNPSERCTRLERTGFLGKPTIYGDLETLASLFEAIEREDFVSARFEDPDFVSFHCRDCGKAYCERCWKQGPAEFDDGFYDCSRATCPEGHEQIIDD